MSGGEPGFNVSGGGGIDEEHAFVTLPEDMDHFEPILESAINRVPLLETAGIQLFFNGPESFTPDVKYYLGEAPEVKNVYVAAGFNSIGIQSSGGAGLVLSKWIKNGHPPMDVTGMDIRRIHPFQSVKNYVRERVSELDIEVAPGQMLNVTVSLGGAFAPQWVRSSPRRQKAFVSK